MKFLKTHCIWAVLLMATACSTETIRVSDEVSTREYDFGSITALEVATDFKAYVSFSDTEERFRIEANDNLFEKIDIFRQGDKLTVKLKNNVNVRGKEILNLFITTRRISNYTASSDASIFLETPLNTASASINLSSDAFFEGDITTERFDLRGSSDSKAKLYLDVDQAIVNLSSGAEIEGEVIINEADVKLSSDSTVDVMGRVEDLDATLSSDSKFKDYALEVEHLKVNLSSDSKAYLTVSKTIDVTANSDSKLFYKGEADIIRQVLSSDGRVIKK